MKTFTYGLALVELVMVLVAIRTGMLEAKDEARLACPGQTSQLNLEAALPSEPTTRVSVSESGRVFVSFPERQPGDDRAMAEIGPDGSVRSYPDQSWNDWGATEALNPSRHFVRICSLACDGEGKLWALDAGAMEGRAPESGAAKLIRIDLETNRVDRVYAFRDSASWRDAEFSGLRIDGERDVAYLTDARTGGLVVLHLGTGRAHRLPAASAQADASGR